MRHRNGIPTVGDLRANAALSMGRTTQSHPADQPTWQKALKSGRRGDEMQRMSPRVPTRPLRTALAVAVAMASFLAMTGCEPSHTSKQTLVRTQLNQQRSKYGRRALPMHAQAAAKAQAWAEKLARDGRLSHSNLESGISTRWCALGENVGMGPGSSTIHNAFMNSSGHRANVLSTKWNGVGTGYVRKGNTTYVVHVFIKTC
jgi:uncharacterized protein YkwD